MTSAGSFGGVASIGGLQSEVEGAFRGLLRHLPAGLLCGAREAALRGHYLSRAASALTSLKSVEPSKACQVFFRLR